MFSTPVLFLIFNKPAESLQVFEAIRNIRPTKLFIAADGARAHKPGEAQLCNQTRAQIMQNIDWSCEVHTLFRDHNLGCKNAIHSSISWFFTHVDMGIILEDDCLPCPDFFFYCWELLERFANDPRVGAISGDHFVPKLPIENSYYGFDIPLIWGWATWRRAWKLYDPCLNSWPSLRANRWLEHYFSSPADAIYWTNIFDQVYHNQIDTWDYQWTYTCLTNRLLTLNPSANLVTNIGLGSPQATHTTADVPHLCIPHGKLTFPLQHPSIIQKDTLIAEAIYQRHFRG